jgi:hypothetical protein
VSTDPDGLRTSTSESKGKNWNKTITTGPFHELRKKWKVASREFLSLQDFLTTRLQKLKGQSRAHWLAKPTEGRAVFFKAVFVKPLLHGKDYLVAFREKVFGKACYVPLPQEPAPPALPAPDAEQITGEREKRLLAPPGGDALDPARDDEHFAGPEVILAPNKTKKKKR